MRSIPAPAGLHLNPTVIPASHVTQSPNVCVRARVLLWARVFTTRGLIFALPHRDNTCLEKEYQQPRAE